MSEHECKYCEEDLYGDWVSITEGEFCNREHAQLWKKDQRISDLERRNSELLQFQDRTLRGQCVCSSDGTEREHYPGCRLRDVARIAEMEKELSRYRITCCQCFLEDTTATRTKEQK